jgi:hypothetical protein
MTETQAFDPVLVQKVQDYQAKTGLRPEQHLKILTAELEVLKADIKRLL